MKLSEETKNKILEILDSKEFMSDLYEGLDEKKRIELGQFYTPGKICIQMIEKYSVDSLAGLNILDPTCGSGNLLIAALIAGADSDKLFGNEYDSTAVTLCRRRLNRACDILNKPHINDWQIHQGNALHEFALKEFSPDYEEMYFDGVKAAYAKQRKLDDVKYNAYVDSKAFRKAHRDLYEAYYDKQLKEQSRKAAEANCGFDWFNM